MEAMRDTGWLDKITVLIGQSIRALPSPRHDLVHSLEHLGHGFPHDVQHQELPVLHHTHRELILEGHVLQIMLAGLGLCGEGMVPQTAMAKRCHLRGQGLFRTAIPFLKDVHMPGDMLRGRTCASPQDQRDLMHVAGTLT